MMMSSHFLKRHNLEIAPELRHWRIPKIAEAPQVERPAE
jgi:hypothetical protein